MAPMDAIWLLLVKTQSLPTTLWLPNRLHPPVLVVLATPVKYNLKWQAIQLDIQCIVDTVDTVEKIYSYKSIIYIYKYTVIL